MIRISEGFRTWSKTCRATCSTSCSIARVVQSNLQKESAGTPERGLGAQLQGRTVFRCGPRGQTFRKPSNRELEQVFPAARTAGDLPSDTRKDAGLTKCRTAGPRRRAI